MKTIFTRLTSLFVLAFFIACSSGSDDSGGCAKVSDATFSASTTSVDLQYYGEANSYIIEWGVTGFAQGSGTTMTTSNSYITIQNLLPSTTYDFYIKSICSDTEMSAAYKLSSVTTNPSQCTGNTSVVISQFYENQVDLSYSYTDFAQSYEMEYGLQGFTLGTGSYELVQGTSQSIMGLDPATTYDFYVRAVCSQGDYAPWKKFTFTTMTSCPAPSNLNSYHISGSCNSGTATRGFSWSYPFGTPDHYEFSLIATIGTAPENGNIEITSNTSIAFTNMFCLWKGFYVRAYCGNGDYSAWAGPFYW